MPCITQDEFQRTLPAYHLNEADDCIWQVRLPTELPTEFNGLEDIHAVQQLKTFPEPNAVIPDPQGWQASTDPCY